MFTKDVLMRRGEQLCIRCRWLLSLLSIPWWAFLSSESERQPEDGRPVEWELRRKARESEGHRWGGIRSALMHRDVPSLPSPTGGTFVQWDFHSAFLSPGELQWLMLSSLWGCRGWRGQGWGLRQRHGETHREPSHSYPTLQGSWVVAAPDTWELKGTRAWGVQDWRAGTPGAARRRGMIPLPVCNKNSLQ